jgi:hypothetical protein
MNWPRASVSQGVLSSLLVRPLRLEVEVERTVHRYSPESAMDWKSRTELIEITLGRVFNCDTGKFRVF